MKHILFILSLLIISSIKISAQKDLTHAKIYLSEGKVIEGQIKSNFAVKPHVKVYMDDKKKNYSKRKIDSILIGEDKYFTEKDFLTTNFLREVEKGTISLYEVNNNLTPRSRFRELPYRALKEVRDMAWNITSFFHSWLLPRFRLLPISGGYWHPACSKVW